MSELIIPLIIIAVLIILNGVFVAAEFAIIGAPRAAIERRAAEGHRVAQLVSSILHDPLRQDRYIATAQLGITFASLGLGMYGEHTLAHWIAERLEGTGTSRWIAAHTLASILAISFLTYFHIVIGEMVPKSMALMHAERTVLWITRPMLFVKMLLYPLVIGLNGLGNSILHLVGVKREFSTGNYHTSEELRYIVEESQQGGMLRAEQGQVLRDLFTFGERAAREVMVPRVRVDGLKLGTTPEELRAILHETQRTRYPVYIENLDQIAGVVHIKDVLRLLRDNLSLEQSGVRPIAFVPETTELNGVLEAMHKGHTHMVVVMDEHGGTAGIITIEDLCVEVVGEFEEGSEDMRELRRDSEGRLCTSGMTRLDDVGEALGLILEHDEVDTVSGLVLSLLDRPPVTGDIVNFENLQFEVLDIEGHGVAECRVTPLPTTEADAE
jgi:CBS domain containing-hemolysin-like protein